MTIDERIEALTHSVELLASMFRDSEARWEGRWEKLTTVLTQLTVVAENHERRIQGMEGK